MLIVTQLRVQAGDLESQVASAKSMAALINGIAFHNPGLGVCVIVMFSRVSTESATHESHDARVYENT